MKPSPEMTPEKKENISLDAQKIPTPSIVSSFIQGSLSFINRHLFTTIKTIKDLKQDPVEVLKGKPELIVKGASYRFIQQNFAVGAITNHRKQRRANNPEISDAQVITETAILEGTASGALETMAAKDMLKNSGKDISSSRELFSTIKYKTPPTIVRAVPVWWASGVKTKTEHKTLERASYGAIAGAVSSIPDSLSVSSMQHSKFDKSLGENIEVIRKGFSIRNAIRAIPFRIVPGILGALIMSDETGKKISEALNLDEDTSTKYKASTSNTKNPINSSKAEDTKAEYLGPNNSPTNPNSKQLANTGKVPKGPQK